ncbi:UvrD-helicase domain-containing protein [Peribacillus simplex]|uniref:UvrD-helicase domain-containing protein n=1 Tax=Peribacillus simplex TaxID=1478 RepID=UPI003D2C6DAC
MPVEQKRKNPVDQEQRDAILLDEGSVVISASAGSGKTTIMAKKLGLELNKIKNHRTVAAITFTVKAKDEIKKKSNEITEKPFQAMTNDSFVESEVIRPFIRDAFGKAFNNDFTVEYGTPHKFDTYQEGLQQLRDKDIRGTFKVNKKNFNFQLALDIIEKSVAAQEYLKAKYEMIFIDEYQDSDYDMHLFFMKLKRDLKIRLFIVGDAKQAIYKWRGAMDNIFDLLKEEESFSHYELVTNFRCDEQIENFANLIHNFKYYKKYEENVRNVILKSYNQTRLMKSNFMEFDKELNDLIEREIIDPEKEITIIANYNQDALKLTTQLNNSGFNFVFIPRTPIDDGLPNGPLLKELAMFIKNENSSYSIYDFMENIQISDNHRARIDTNNIIKKLKKSENVIPEVISEVLDELTIYLGISISDEEIEKFCQSVCNNQYDIAFRITEEKHKVMTVFASKGLEFDQVISFSKYYNIANNQGLENHYVCVTRAKNKFVMVLDDDSYYQHLEYLARENSIKNVNYLFCYF